MIPVLETNRLVLRPLLADDAQDIFDYAQDPEVSNPGMWQPYGSFEECSDHVAHLVGLYSRGLMWWALECKTTGKVVGRVELSDWEDHDKRAELSYALARERWGQGLMTEAVESAVHYGWQILRLNRLSAKVIVGNAASIKLLAKVGMVKEGRLRQYIKIKEKWEDVDVYSVLRRDVLPE